MTELQELMLQNVAEPPHDDVDFAELVAAGRRRARARQVRIAGVATSVVVTVAAGALLAPRMAGVAGSADAPAPDAPTLHLSDAMQGVAGRDFSVLASHINQNLDRDNGQYFDGVTDDGQILFRDGPHAGQLFPRLALMDPATGTMDWLPDPHLGQDHTLAADLGADRLVLLTMGGSVPTGPMIAHIYDRGTRHWHTMTWPGLPDIAGPSGVMGPDQRLYVSVRATQGQPPAGGWPTGPGGEADDSGAPGDTYDLWSVSLTDPSDVRDQHLSVGSVAFTPTSMVWTDRTNGSGGMVHVRDLASGQEHSFDPRTGSRCNLLSLSAADDRLVLSEYCGTGADGVRDDRVQIISTNGDQVVTIQDSGIGGSVLDVSGHNDVVTIDSSEGDALGTYVYDLGTGRFVRVSDGTSNWAMGGPAPSGEFMWSSPVNHGHGATQWLGRLLPANG